MAYRLITGNPPFHGGASQLMYQHFHTPPPPPCSINPLLHSEIDAVFARALAKQPGMRFPSVATFSQALQKAVSMNTTTLYTSPITDGADTIPPTTRVLPDSAGEQYEQMSIGSGPTMLLDTKRSASSNVHPVTMQNGQPAHNPTPTLPTTPSSFLHQSSPLPLSQAGLLHVDRDAHGSTRRTAILLLVLALLLLTGSIGPSSISAATISRKTRLVIFPQRSSRVPLWGKVPKLRLPWEYTLQ